MATEEEIITKHRAIHKKLKEDWYSGKHKLSKTKAEFDTKHGQNWNDLEAELIVEGYKQPPEPPRDLAAEIDEIKDEIEKLKAGNK